MMESNRNATTHERGRSLARRLGRWLAVIAESLGSVMGGDS